MDGWDYQAAPLQQTPFAYWSWRPVTWPPGMVAGLTSKLVVSNEVVLTAKATDIYNVSPHPLNPNV